MKKAERHRAIDINIYSFKILFTSFHLNNQTVSRRRILSSCCFDLFNSFLRSVRTATLDTSFWHPFELYNSSLENMYICFLMWPPQLRNGNSNPVRFDQHEYYCDFLCMHQYLKRTASPIDKQPDILKFVTLLLSKDFVYYFRHSRFCLESHDL